MSELAQQLRQCASDLINGMDDAVVPVTMLCEAADEIERLAAWLPDRGGGGWQKRADETWQWLADHAPEVSEDQYHLDDGLPERAYWHYGYLMALTDVLRTVEQRVKS